MTNKEKLLDKVLDNLCNNYKVPLATIQELYRILKHITDWTVMSEVARICERCGYTVTEKYAGYLIK